LDEPAREPNNMASKYRAAFAQGRGFAWGNDGTFNQLHVIPVTDVSSLDQCNLASGRSDFLRSMKMDTTSIRAPCWAWRQMVG
jgi:hypothetical protein